MLLKQLRDELYFALPTVHKFFYQVSGRRPRSPLQWTIEVIHMPNSARPSLAMSHPGVQKLCCAFLKTCLVAILFLPLHVFAQTGLATLSGTVTDPTGALLPKATVTVTNEDTGVTVKGETTRAGVFDIEALNPGKYRVVVEHQGFKQIEVLHLVLHTQDVISRNFVLPVGAASEVIQVNGNQQSIDESPAVSLTVDSEFIENMPLNGRSIQDLISLAPGTASSANPYTGAGLYSINGQRDDANYFTVDGVSANTNTSSGANPTVGASGSLPAQTAIGTTQSLVSVDALQEFTIQTSSYSAEFGRQPGGQIQLTTKSGAESFHGTTFDYFRNEALDGNSWFFNHNGIPRQAERQNDFGGTFGGPFRLPGSNRKIKDFFFFFSYEGLRLKTPAFSGVVNVPTAQFRSFANSNVGAILSEMPLPNVAGNMENGDQCAASLGLTFSCTGEFAAGYSNPNNIDATSIRLDKKIGDRLQLFVRYADTPSNSNYRTLTDVNPGYDNSRIETLGATVKVSDHSVAQIRLNHTVDANGGYQYLDTFHGGTPFDPSILAPSQFVAAGSYELAPYISLSGLDGINLYGPTGINAMGTIQSAWNVLGDITRQFANHSIKIGTDFRQLHPTIHAAAYLAEPSFLSLAGVQQGFIDSDTVQDGSPGTPTYRNLSFYAEDVWKPIARLTLTYGLRWDLNPAPGAADGLYPLALSSSNIQTSGIAPAGTPQYHTDYLNFAPRLGFSYVIANPQHRPFVLRGGSGIFFDTGQELGAAGYFAFPFQNSATGSNVPLPSTFAAPPLPAPLVPPFGFVLGISDPNLKVPYTEQWSLSLDKGLSNNNTLSASYVGNNGRKLLKTDLYASTSNPLFTVLTFSDNSGYSSYNSLQVQDRGSISSHVQLIASYTWAHAIDNVSADSNSTFEGSRGNSVNDIRETANIALNASVPSPQGNPVLKALLEGWSFGSRGTAESGYPIDVVSGVYVVNGTIVSFRPNLNPNVPIYLHNKPDVLGNWALNPSAFTQVATNPSGLPVSTPTLGRNFIHGPNFWAFNESMQRAFHLGERSSLLFRVDAFNLFNHPNPGLIDPNIYDGPGLFGTSQGLQTLNAPNQLYAMGSPRSLQLSLKIPF